MKKILILIATIISFNLNLYSQFICTSQESECGKLLWKGFLTETIDRDFAKAVEIYKEAIRKDSLCCDAYNYLASAYMKINDYGRVEYICRESLRITPNNYLAHSRIGLVFYYRGLYDSSISYFSKALTLNNTNLDILQNLSLAYSKKNMKEEAFKTISTALGIANTKPNLEIKDASYLYLTAGIIYYKYGAKPAALNLLLKAEPELSKDSELNYYLGLYYNETNNSRKAKRYLKKAVKFGYNVDSTLKEKYQIQK